MPKETIMKEILLMIEYKVLEHTQILMGQFILVTGKTTYKMDMAKKSGLII